VKQDGLSPRLNAIETNETEKLADKDLMDISETLKVNMTCFMLQHHCKFGLRVCNHGIILEFYLLVSILQRNKVEVDT